jgi:hypothetical protein
MLIEYIAWMPDGRSLVYDAMGAPESTIWRVGVDGSRPPERLGIPEMDPTGHLREPARLHSRAG